MGKGPITKGEDLRKSCWLYSKYECSARAVTHKKQFKRLELN
jgi:hypothetical protein